jgi:peptidoglycan/xylan/chitin deacetylase (PgdA/CDA1 family)
VELGREAVRASRRALKQAVAGALEASGGRRLLAARVRRRAGGTRVLVVAYHRVVPDFEGLRRRVIPGLLTSTRTFDRQLAWLSRRYRPASMEEALDVLSGRIRSGEDRCVVTFDDGYADVLEHAAPILRKHGFPATLYVPSGFVEGGVPLLHDRLYRVLRIARERNVDLRDVGGDGRVRAALELARSDAPILALDRLLEHWPREVCVACAAALERRLGEDPAAGCADSRLLGWEELRALTALGFTIGGHTVDHACLPNESPAETERQLRASRERMEAELRRPVMDFAYPNGWWSHATIRALARNGYRSAVTTEDRPNRIGVNPYRLQRKSVWEYTSRGLLGYSDAVTACNLDGAFGSLGLAPWVPGERLDAVGTPPSRAAEPVGPARTGSGEASPPPDAATGA